MKTGYYKADCINGVYFYDSLLDEPETDIISPEHFLDNLSTVSENEEITTFLDLDSENIYNCIKAEYGIS